MKTAKPLTCAALMLLAGCATFSDDGGFNHVQKIASDKLNQKVVWARSDDDKSLISQRTRALLAKPLSADAAVEIALLQNPGLQAAYFKLGIAEAAVVQAARLPNPHLAMVRASHLDAGGREYKIEQALTFNLFALLTQPQQYAIASNDFTRMQNEVAQSMLRHAYLTRKAWVSAVAAQESVGHFERAQAAADAAAELAKRMAQVGNINRLQHAREHTLYAETTVALARARGQREAARLKLAQMLGLWGEGLGYQLPARLPDLPDALPDNPTLEQRAVAERLDLQIVRLDTETLARQLGLTKTTRLINVLEVGPARVLEGPRDAPFKTGYEIAFELPLFDWGGARVAGARARYERQLNLAAQAAIDARAEVRQAAHHQRLQFDIARHYRDEILPLARRISEENLLRYNAMLIDTLTLLTDTRAQIASVNAALDARRDYWLAQADVDMALIGQAELSAATATSLGAPAAAAH